MGVAPGMGKSTLCGGLSGWLAGRGLRVDHFREEDLGSRAEFAAVAAEFAATTVVAPVTLLPTVAGQPAPRPARPLPAETTPLRAGDVLSCLWPRPMSLGRS
jgi:hypothetical protein